MARDEAWFEGFYRHNERFVRAYCLRRVDANDAADAVAQVFAVVWRRRDDVPAGDAATRWLYGVARRVLSHHWRGERRAQNLVDRAGSLRTVEPPGPEGTAVASAEQQLVRDAVMDLRPRDREVLLLSAWEGLTHAEIADVVGASVAAVDKRVARAKLRLADRYKSNVARGTVRTAVGADDLPSPSMRTREGGGTP